MNPDLEADLRVAAHQCGVPDYMVDGFIRWLDKGIYPGGFLRAVLENDLASATAHADSLNIHLLRNYAGFLYGYMPPDSWGSAAKVLAWHEAKQTQTREGDPHGT